MAVVLTAYLLLAPQTATHDDKDWTHLWLGGRMVAAGHAADLYDPDRQVEVYREADPQGRPPSVWEERNRMFGCFNYPPPAALFYAVFAWLPVGTAAVVHAYVSIGLALLAARLLASLLDCPGRWPAMALAVLVYPPFFINLALGQNAVFTMTVVAAAWWLIARRRDLAAGLVLGLLVCKPNWLVALAWIPLLHGRLRMLAGLSLGAAGVAGATALIVGIGPLVDYFDVLRQVARLETLPSYYLDIQYSGWGLFRKWFGIGPTADTLAGMSSAILVVATWWVTRESLRPADPSFRPAMACCLMTAQWVNPHLNYYDLLVSTPCATVVLIEWPVLTRRAKVAAVCLVALAYVAVPWDEAWAWRHAVPVPSLAMLAMWAWLATRTITNRRRAIQDNSESPHTYRSCPSDFRSIPALSRPG